MTQLRLSELCTILAENRLPARLEGADHRIHAVNTLESAIEGEISFLSSTKYVSALKETKASAVISKEDVHLPTGLSAIRCADPYAAVAAAIIALHGHRRHPQWGIDVRASVHPTATIGADANIAGYATIGAGVAIGDRCTIYPGCYVADGARVGHDCTLYPNVVIYDGCELGDRVTIHAGSVIGEDGLGYAPRGDKWVKIPQVGRAVIGDDVEIGANCTVDRATLGRTEIGAGSKFGNVIVIGHGARVGPDCMFVGLVGVAGSATVGRHVTLAGQVGVGGHLTVGDHVVAGGRTAIMGSVEPGVTLLGTPAAPAAQARRSAAAVAKLPEWLKRIKDLEREVKALRAAIDNPS